VSAAKHTPTPLKPCPCCGMPAEFDYLQPYRALGDGRIGSAAAIYCTACSLQISECYRDCPERSEEDVQDFVRARWNLRVSHDALVAALEKLVAALDTTGAQSFIDVAHAKADARAALKAAKGE
jgi:hypothetical protein